MSDLRRSLVVFTFGAVVMMNFAMRSTCEAQGKAESPVDHTRLVSVMAQLRRGGTIKVAAIGGSITTGYQATPLDENSWAAIVRRWFEKKALESGGQVLFRNAGVSGTDSAFASIRVQDHIISYDADLVIVEFAVNDQWLDPKVRGRSYESLVRRLLSDSNRALVCLFLNEKGDARKGQGVEQRRIAEHYAVPWISWAEGIAPRIASGDETWDEFYNKGETIHPNSKGHVSIARVIVEYLEKIWREAGESSQPDSSHVRTLPEAIHGNDFQNARLLGSTDIAPLENSGWEPGSDVHSEWRALGGAKEGWTAQDPQATMSFKIKAKMIGIAYSESDQYRNAEAWVEFSDGTTTKKVSLECYVSYRKGYLGWAYREIATFPEEREVVLRVAVKKSRTTDNGKKANITGIVVAGRE